MTEKSHTFADFVKGKVPKEEYDKICEKADKLQQENLGRIADWPPDYEYDIKCNKTPEEQREIVEKVSVMPEIIKMRKEWKKKYGDTRMFDHFYMGLRDRVGKSWLRSMKEAQELGAKFAYHPNKTKKVQIGSRVMDVYVNEWDNVEEKEDD